MAFELDPNFDADLRDALIRQDFSTFAQTMFPEVMPGIELVWATYLTFVCAMLEDVAHGRRRKLIITIPPRHLKSFLVSVALPAYLLGHYPGFEVMCVSYGYELAKGFAEQCQTIMRSETFVRLFGQVLPSKRQPIHTLRTLKGGMRRATSLDGVATGVGGQLLIFDDPQKPGEALSDAIRRSTNELYQNTFHSRSNDPANQRTIIVMQRLHEEDFVSFVGGLDPEFEIINLPAIAEQDEALPYETFLGPHVFRRREGEPLNPKRYPLPELLKTQKIVGSAVWATQYQQRPAPAGGGLVRIDWFKRYTDATLPTRFDRTVQSWDTANTAAEKSDFSVCTTWGVKGKHIFLLHVLRDRMIYPDLRRAVLKQAQLHDPDVVYIEDYASGTQVLQELRSQGHGKFRPIKHTQAKKERMVNQTAVIENGFVHLPMEAPWLEVYLHELAVFPRGKHDDQVDSTSQALDNIDKWTSAFGLHEFYRQEFGQPEAEDNEVWVLRPPGVNVLFDREGVRHDVEADGCFHLNRETALPHLNAFGWTVVSNSCEER